MKTTSPRDLLTNLKMLELHHIAIILIGIVAFALQSHRIERSILTLLLMPV